MLSTAAAHAAPPADDFLRTQKPGPRLTLMPFIGPGFRATYDHRFELEKEATELRTQVIGTVTVPFAEISANVDIRLFLMMFGGSVGYHDEWHTLQFNPDPHTGRDRAGQPINDLPAVQSAPGAPVDPTPTFTDLTRSARAIKDQTADIQQKSWAFYEGRWGFVWPAYNFTGVSNLAFRHDGRPDVSYDWENGTVMNGGWNIRWEGYALFQSRNAGFIGPAVRLLYVPRNRLTRSFITDQNAPVPEGSACVANEFGAITPQVCKRKYEVEVQYGILAGLRPNWVGSSDTFLIRAYTTLGQNNQLFGTQVFRMPLQLLFAYMVDIDL